MGPEVTGGQEDSTGARYNLTHTFHLHRAGAETAQSI